MGELFRKLLLRKIALTRQAHKCLVQRLGKCRQRRRRLIKRHGVINVERQAVRKRGLPRRRANLAREQLALKIGKGQVAKLVGPHVANVELIDCAHVRDLDGMLPRAILVARMSLADLSQILAVGRGKTTFGSLLNANKLLGIRHLGAHDNNREVELILKVARDHHQGRFNTIGLAVLVLLVRKQIGERIGRYQEVLAAVFLRRRSIDLVQLGHDLFKLPLAKLRERIQRFGIANVLHKEVDASLGPQTALATATTNFLNIVG